jgi:hypothetical protein
VADNTKLAWEIKVKRTAKNSVFLDLFQDKKNLLQLYQTLHPEDTEATEDTLDIDIEIKAKVIYESNTDDIINQYIIFCKVFDDQRKLHGMTEQTVAETIRICKDKNVLRKYLESREKEVVTIMMTLFDEEQIMKTYLKDVIREMEKDVREKVKKDVREEVEKDVREEMEKETARRLIKKGKLSLEEIADYIPALSLEELQELEAEVKQLV